jgi:RNA polymerase primary sigma factor
LTRQIEDEFSHVQRFIRLDKKRCYLLYDEVNDSLPAEVDSSQEIDDVLSILERQGIVIYEDVAAANAVRTATNATEDTETEGKEGLAFETDLDLSSA